MTSCSSAQLLAKACAHMPSLLLSAKVWLKTVRLFKEAALSRTARALGSSSRRWLRCEMPARERKLTRRSSRRSSMLQRKSRRSWALAPSMLMSALSAMTPKEKQSSLSKVHEQWVTKTDLTKTNHTPEWLLLWCFSESWINVTWKYVLSFSSQRNILNIRFYQWYAKLQIANTRGKWRVSQWAVH